MNWDESLATGIPQIDMQHKALFDTLSVLEKAAAEGRYLATMSGLETLTFYARTHLADEERLMERHGYPKLEKHRAEHKKFKAALYKLRLANTHCDNVVEVVGFISEWLTNHVNKTDLEFATYLRKNAR